MMQSDEFLMPFAESAYNAYGEKAKWKTWNNKPMPQWDAVGDEVQSRWLAAVKDVFLKLEVRTDDEGHFVQPGHPQEENTIPLIDLQHLVGQ